MEKTKGMRSDGIDKSNKSRSFETRTFKTITFQTDIINSILNIKSTMDNPLNHVRYVQRSRTQSLNYPKSVDFKFINLVAIYDEYLSKYT